MSRPASSWEKCLEKALFQFYHFANEQVASLHPSVRKQLMVVSRDGTGSLLLTKIVQGANEAADLVDSMVDDDIEDDGIHREFEIKQQYEKFQNGSANVSHFFMKPMDGDNFKKYRRIGLLFVLFMARTLEAEAKPNDVYDDPNVR
jgi:hypothetical protein